MSGPVEDAAAAPAMELEEIEDADLQDQTTNSKAKKTKWKKAPLSEFWEPPPYVPAGKGQAAQRSQSAYTGEKQGPTKGGKTDKGGRKGGGKGREKGRFRDDCGGKGKKGEDGPAQNEHPDSGPTLPPRGEGAYVPPRPATTVGEEGLEDRFSMKGRREGGKRGGGGFDGKGGKGGRFARCADGCGRKSGSGKGRPYGSASDMQGTNFGSSSPEATAASEQVMQGGHVGGGPFGQANKGGGTQPKPTGRMPSKGGVSASMPAFCAAMPLGATVLPAHGSGGKGVAAFPGAPMPFTTGYNAIPCYGNASMPATYAMPYFVMPATAAGYPQVSAAAMAASGPSAAFQMSSQDGEAGPLPPNMQGIPLFMPTATDTPGDGDVKNRVMQQMEYYFSTENLIKDMYLRMQMNPEGWVPIGLIASFPSIKSLTADQATMAAAIASSSTLELDPTKTKVRVKDDWSQWLLAS